MNSVNGLRQVHQHNVSSSKQQSAPEQIPALKTTYLWRQALRMSFTSGHSKSVVFRAPFLMAVGFDA